MKGWTRFTHPNLLSACRHMHVCGSPCIKTCWFLLIPSGGWCYLLVAVSWWPIYLWRNCSISDKTPSIHPLAQLHCPNQVHGGAGDYPSADWECGAGKHPGQVDTDALNSPTQTGGTCDLRRETLATPPELKPNTSMFNKHVYFLLWCWLASTVFTIFCTSGFQ